MRQHDYDEPVVPIDFFSLGQWCPFSWTFPAFLCISSHYLTLEIATALPTRMPELQYETVATLIAYQLSGIVEANRRLFSAPLSIPSRALDAWGLQ